MKKNDFIPLESQEALLPIDGLELLGDDKMFVIGGGGPFEIIPDNGDSGCGCGCGCSH